MVIFLNESIEHLQLPFLNSERIHNWNASPSSLPIPGSPSQGAWCRFLLFVFTATSNSASYLPRACNSSRFTPRRFRAFSMQENMTRWRARFRCARSAHKDNKHVGAPRLLFLKSSKRKS